MQAEAFLTLLERWLAGGLTAGLAAGTALPLWAASDAASTVSGGVFAPLLPAEEGDLPAEHLLLGEGHWLDGEAAVLPASFSPVSWTGGAPSSGSLAGTAFSSLLLGEGGAGFSATGPTFPPMTGTAAAVSPDFTAFSREMTPLFPTFPLSPGGEGEAAAAAAPVLAGENPQPVFLPESVGLEGMAALALPLSQAARPAVSQAAASEKEARKAAGDASSAGSGFLEAESPEKEPASAAPAAVTVDELLAQLEQRLLQEWQGECHSRFTP